MFTDPTGEFAVPPLVILPVVAGTINGISNVLSKGEWDSGLTAFASGFVAGGTGMLAGLGVTSLTGNPVVGGAAGGAAGDLVNQSLNGPVSGIDWGQAGWAAAFGSAGSAGASAAAKTVGRLPVLSTPRNPSNWGKNSTKLVTQEVINGGAGAASGAVWTSALNPKPDQSCSCRR